MPCGIGIEENAVSGVTLHLQMSLQFLDIQIFNIFAFLGEKWRYQYSPGDPSPNRAQPVVPQGVARIRPGSLSRFLSKYQIYILYLIQKNVMYICICIYRLGNQEFYRI
jgi:hypothetical protein